ncbi:MAG: hypothetical protein P4N60_13975 [Verrucomicrobiae bacterium]|nr:hypothetical protein [Verrucomicrobiae bacterium]
MKHILGKFLFPRHPGWQGEREAAVLVATVLFALVFAGVVGLVIYWRNNIGR